MNVFGVQPGIRRLLRRMRRNIALLGASRTSWPNRMLERVDMQVAKIALTGNFEHASGMSLRKNLRLVADAFKWLTSSNASVDATEEDFLVTVWQYGNHRNVLPDPELLMMLDQAIGNGIQLDKQNRLKF